MENDTFMASFIVRLPIPRRMSRLDAENILREHILESGMWQGHKKVYVRESMHLTPEQEIHRAELARLKSEATLAAKIVEAEAKVEKREKKMLAELRKIV
jgi:hypothetical protein